VYFVAGGLVSGSAALLLGLIAFGIVLVFAGSPTEGGYCSDSGIGSYEARSSAKVVAYIDEGWGGFPPGQHCRVYLTAATDDNPLLTGERPLQGEIPSHRLLAEGIYPGTQEYVWVVGAFLLPLAIWGLLLVIVKFGGRPEAS
jgi:hypothetical protein